MLKKDSIHSSSQSLNWKLKLIFHNGLPPPLVVPNKNLPRAIIYIPSISKGNVFWIFWYFGMAKHKSTKNKSNSRENVFDNVTRSIDHKNKLHTNRKNN